MSKILKHTIFLVLTVAVAIAGVICLPVINLLTTEKPLPAQTSDQTFASISPVLQISCKNCHTPNLTNYPIYFHFPVANQIIKQDIMKAQSAFPITAEQLTGAEPFTSLQMTKLAVTIESARMPPSNYTFMHWNAFIQNSEKQRILSWLDQQNPHFGIKPIPEDNPFHRYPNKVKLGKQLYFDKQLSSDNTIACVTCHALDKGGTDQEKVSKLRF